MDESPPRRYRGVLMGRNNMGSITKRQKIAQKQNANQCEDRISNLPSNLVSHILSFLPTKNAVATSALSTRWKQFWTLITSVDFDYTLSQYRWKSTRRTLLPPNLTSFLYRVLERVSCLHKFRMKCSQSCDVSHVNAWITAILKHPIQELDLSMPLENLTHVLPQELFSCRTLVVLKLGTKFVMNVPTSVCLPRLKILHLDNVKFQDDDSIKRLFLGCPVLDELNMNECVGKKVRIVHICAPVLTKLKYVKDKLRYGFLGTTEVTEYKIVIDTPALLYLELIDYEAEVHLVKNPLHIIKADISIAVQYERTPSPIIDLLRGVSKVQSLHLYNNSAEAVHDCVSQLPMFNNLTSLVLGAGYGGWKWVHKLLERSPHLESLVFEEGYEEVHDEDDHDDEDERGEDEYGEDVEYRKALNWRPPQSVPSCLLFHLKVMKFVSSQGCGGHLKLVAYFLRNAEVLDKIFIESVAMDEYAHLEDEVEDLRKLLMLPRSSRTCQVKHRVKYLEL